MNRLAKRKAKKRQNNRDNYNTRKNRNAPICDSCGGQMHWCSCCEVYSQNCCIPYGTCMCS